MIRHNRFSPLFWTQFFGALNDNFLKNSLVMLITFKGIKLFGFESSVLVAFAGGIFILPFFLFSTHAGQLADKYEKSFLVVVTKIWEVGIALIASVGFYLESYGILLLLLFLMGVQSTFFGPLKYSIIPDLVEKEDLTEANAYVEMGTFVSILLGTIAGGLSTNIENSTAYIITGLITVSIFGLIASRRLPKIGKGQSQLKIKLNPIPSMVDLFRNLAGQKILFQSIIAISWFWFFGAGILSILPVFGREFLRVGPDIVTAFLAMFTLGIGIGSLICNKLSFKQVEIGLVPLGAIGMSIFLIDIYFFEASWTTDLSSPLNLSNFLSYPLAWRLLGDFFFMSISGGLFIVPLYSLVQQRSPVDFLSRAIACNNILNALFMVISSLLVMVLCALKVSYSHIFLIFGSLNSPSFQEADKVARSGFGSMMNGYYLIVDRVGQFMSKSPWFQSFDKFLNDPEGQQLMAANAKGYYDSMVNTASTFIEAEEQAKNRTKDVIVDTIVQKVWKVQADYLADGIDYLVENNKKTAAYLVATNPNIKVIAEEIKLLGSVYRERLTQAMSDSERFRITDEYVKNAVKQMSILFGEEQK